MKSAARLALALALTLPLGACLAQVSGLDLTDAGIKARIEAQFQAAKELDSSHLVLDVHARIATVSGVVKSWDEKLIVERIVRRTMGVEQSLVNVVIQE